MVNIDKDSQKYKDRLEAYKRMISRKLSASQNLIISNKYYLELMGEKVLEESNDEFLYDLDALEDFVKRVAGTTITKKAAVPANRKGNMEEIAEYIASSIPDEGYFFSEFTTVEIGKTLREIYKDSPYVKRLYEVYGCNFIDEKYNIADTIMGIIGIHKMRRLFDELKSYLPSDNKKLTSEEKEKRDIFRKLLTTAFAAER